MTSVLGLVLISMSACLMPKSVPQGLGATPEGHPVEVEHQQRWQRKVDKLPFREAHLHTRRTLHGTVGGGLEGGPVVDSLRVGRSRVSRVLAHRGGASADLGGANKTVGRSNARGRPGLSANHQSNPRMAGSILHWMKRIKDLKRGKLQKITLEELSKHNTLNDCWTCIHGYVYNITDYVPYHPGGESKIMESAGRNATQRFLEVHPYVSLEAILHPYCLGRLIT